MSRSDFEKRLERLGAKPTKPAPNLASQTPRNTESLTRDFDVNDPYWGEKRKGAFVMPILKGLIASVVLIVFLLGFGFGENTLDAIKNKAGVLGDTRIGQSKPASDAADVAKIKPDTPILMRAPPPKKNFVMRYLANNDAALAYYHLPEAPDGWVRLTGRDIREVREAQKTVTQWNAANAPKTFESILGMQQFIAHATTSKRGMAVFYNASTASYVGPDGGAVFMAIERSLGLDAPKTAGGNTGQSIGSGRKLRMGKAIQKVTIGGIVFEHVYTVAAKPKDGAKTNLDMAALANRQIDPADDMPLMLNLRADFANESRITLSGLAPFSHAQTLLSAVDYQALAK